MSSIEYCHVCSSKGKASQLRLYQINFDEAVKFCEDDKVILYLLIFFDLHTGT
jgi:hypothetical protein